MQFGRRLQSAQFGEHNSDEGPSYSHLEPQSDEEVSRKLDVSDLALQILQKKKKKNFPKWVKKQKQMNGNRMIDSAIQKYIFIWE